MQTAFEIPQEDTGPGTENQPQGTAADAGGSPKPEQAQGPETPEQGASQPGPQEADPQEAEAQGPGEEKPQTPRDQDTDRTRPRAKKATEDNYTASDIQVLEGLEAVRKRPGMYIGSTDLRGIHHLIYEIVDNSVDEAMAGHCDSISIGIAGDGVVTVQDNGRGIPVDKHPATGVSALETVMTTLHAGGKFGGGAYKVSGGLHGVGASVVNALSEHLRAEVSRDGRTHFQEYRRGEPRGEMKRSGRTGEHGTRVSFRPDPQIFPAIDYDFDTLAAHFKEVAYLNKALEMNFRSEWSLEKRQGDIERTYFFDSGIASMVKNLNRNRKVIQQTPCHYEKTVDDTSVEFALQYNDGFAESVLSFANCINTQEGGSHITGFRSALTRVINDYARKHGFLKEAEANLAGEDVREGLAAVISVRLPGPPVRGADQEQARQPRDPDGRGVRGGRGADPVPRGQPGRGQTGHRQVTHLPEGPGGRPEGQGDGHPEERHGRLIPAGQAGRLQRTGPVPVRALHRRGRVGGRLRQDGPGPGLPGHPAAQGQDHERRESAPAAGEDDRPRGNPRPGVRHRGR